MIRLTVLLGAGLFLTLLIAGQDNGQMRDGLRLASAVEAAPTPLPAATPLAVIPAAGQVTEVVFVPAQPVARVVEPAPTPEPAVVAAKTAAPPPIVQYIAARSANVRSGPSTSDLIVGNLRTGEAVLVVPQDDPVQGWSRIRIEGDGIEGYVASRLLTDIEPATE